VASEKAVDGRIAKAVRRRGAWTFKVHGSAAMRRGLPDRMVCYRGYFLAIEVKKPGGKPTPIQEHELEQIRHAGGIAIVATDVDVVEEAMNHIDRLVDG
jgi:Holliday junction resolvase